jgi:hypothetical protein
MTMMMVYAIECVELFRHDIYWDQLPSLDSIYMWVPTHKLYHDMSKESDNGLMG